MVELRSEETAFNSKIGRTFMADRREGRSGSRISSQSDNPESSDSVWSLEHSSDPWGTPHDTMGQAHRPKRKIRPPEKLGEQDKDSRLSGSTKNNPTVLDDDEDENYQNDDDSGSEFDGRSTSTSQRGCRKPNYMYMRAQDLKEEHKQLLEHTAKFASDWRAAKKTLAKERKERFEERKERRDLLAEIKEQKKVIAGLRREKTDNLREFHEKLADKENNFAKAERSMLNMVQKTHFTALPDNIIRDKFSAILSSLSDWSKKWGTTDLSTRHEAVSKKVIRDCASDHIQEERVSTLYENLLENPRTAGKILLFAAASRKLLYTFFKSPFFIFGVCEGGETLEFACSGLMEHIQQGK